MGASKQEFAAGSPILGVRQQCGAGGGTRCSKGAQQPAGAAQREGESSPADVAGEAGFWPEGAKKGAKSRTSWGLTEHETAMGYARCGSGCSAPVVVQVTQDEWLCEVCANAMQVAGGAS